MLIAYFQLLQSNDESGYQALAPSVRAEAENFLGGKASEIPPPLPHPADGSVLPPPAAGAYPGQPPVQPVVPHLQRSKDECAYPAHAFPPPLTEEGFLAEQRLQKQRKDMGLPSHLGSRRSHGEERRGRSKEEETSRDRNSSRRPDRRGRDSADRASDRDLDRLLRTRCDKTDRDRDLRSREPVRRSAVRDRSVVDRVNLERERRRVERTWEIPRIKREEDSRSRSKGPENEPSKYSSRDKHRVRERVLERADRDTEPRHRARDEESRTTEGDRKKRKAAVSSDQEMSRSQNVRRK